MTCLIELIGGPASGKTTTALGLCNLLKFYFAEYIHTSFSVEYVSEYAKEIALEYQNIELPYHNKIKNQALIFGTQLERLLQLKDKTDIIINDSSLLLCAEYAPKEFYDENSMLNLIKSNYKHFSDVIHIFVEREENIRFINLGRKETLEQAKAIDNNLKKLLKKYNGLAMYVKGNMSAPFKIIRALGKILPFREDLDFSSWYKNKILQSLDNEDI